MLKLGQIYCHFKTRLAREVINKKKIVLSCRIKEDKL